MPSWKGRSLDEPAGHKVKPSRTRIDATQRPENETSRAEENFARGRPSLDATGPGGPAESRTGLDGLRRSGHGARGDGGDSEVEARPGVGGYDAAGQRRIGTNKGYSS